ncbi:MAG TPA: CoA-transferase [Burkholderiaceae bacterium]|nr:CoA-transferase [Burkholderiaceae bacterium]
MNLISATEAAALVRSGATVASAGFVGCGHAEAVTAALERRFLAEGAPADLTLVYSAGQGDRAHRGVNHFGHAGMTGCIVGGHWRSAPKLSALALEERCAAFNLPQGVITQLYRAIAGGKPGVITKIGTRTFVDPDLDGGAINDTAREAVRLGARRFVEPLTLGGERWLLYPSFPIDVALIRGTAVDARGNLSTEDEAFHHELLAIAQAARNSGGIVIAQARRVVERHENLHAIKVPGILIDHVVLAEHDDEHMMTFAERFNPAYTVSWRGPGHSHEPAPPLPLDVRKIVQRRALLELVARAPRVVNLGVGMPAGIGAVAAEEGVAGFTLTVEAGPIGGTPADGLSFGASAYPEAVVDHPAQFDFYDGGGIDVAFLGLAELDVQGNVNVSLFGEGDRRIVSGVGGFINITQSAREVVFMGTLTAGGLQVEARDGRLRIVREGRVAKLVPRVSHLTFDAAYVASLGRRILYVTERAVFELRDGVLTLVEVAPGIDARSQVLAFCPPGVRVAEPLATMDARIFDAAPMLSRER